LKDKNVLAILPFDATTSLIATAKRPLPDESRWFHPTLACSGKPALEPITNQQWLIPHDGQYAFGTIQNGVIVINKNGQVIQHINKTMVSKTILYLVLSRTIRRISGWDLIMV
jgi:hypothetical protein